MPVYNYVALKNNKTIVKGKVEADDLRSARDTVRKLGFLPTKVFEENQKENTLSGAKKNLRALSLKDKIEFTSTLQILTATGIPIIETLIFMETNAATSNIRDVAFELRRQIIGGSTFADTVARYPEIFGKVYIGLTKAGEDSGELDKTLERMLELLKKQADIKAKVIGALVYPCFIIVLACLVVTVMLVFVFPAFKEMFDNLGRPLPLITQMCMDFGLFLRKFWFVIPLFAISVGFSIYKAFTWEGSRRWIDRTVLKVPLLDYLIKYSNFSNFIAVMQVAYDAGIPIVDCLYLSNLTMDNYTLRDSILDSATKVQQGVHLSTALKASKVMPNMILFMIATGEQSGRLGELLFHCTTFIDGELDKIIDRFTKMIEPMMLIVIGGIVLFLALALYLPLFSAYQQ